LSQQAQPASSSLSVASARLRSPVTWISASATLGGLLAMYEYQKVKQQTAQRVAGKPDLGGPFKLVDWDGKRVTSDDLRGKWTLLYFGFTKCPDICPEELHKVSGVLERLDAKQQQIRPVFITIDPARDTPTRLKDCARAPPHSMPALTSDYAPPLTTLSLRGLRGGRLWERDAAPALHRAHRHLGRGPHRLPRVSCLFYEADRGGD